MASVIATSIVLLILTALVYDITRLFGPDAAPPSAGPAAGPTRRPGGR
ncbi:hypothetical protein ACWEQ2_41285 [Streptomyces sp. NPDC004096]